MYEELAVVRGTVNLSPQAALDEAQRFLLQQGYKIVQRTDTSLTVNRRKREGVLRPSLPNLTAVVEPQPQGGVLIKIRGNDREGVREWQPQWLEWGESLPKMEPKQAKLGKETRDVHRSTDPPSDLSIAGLVREL